MRFIVMIPMLVRRSFGLFASVAIALLATGCAVYPDGTAVLLPPPAIVVGTAPAYAYGGPGYYRPYYGGYYGYRNYGYRPYYRGGYGGCYGGGYYRGRGYCW